MSLLEQLKKNADEKEFAGKHPLLKMGVDRSVRDAYYDGIVLAAFADDNKVDEEERGYLSKLGISLGLPPDDVNDNIVRIESADESKRLGIATEIAETIKDQNAAKLFFIEFTLIWTSHTTNEQSLDALREWRRALAKMMTVDVSDEWLDLIDVARSHTPQRIQAIARLGDFDDEAIAYLFGDVSKAVAEARNAAKESARRQSEMSAQKAAHKNLEEHLCKLIESERPIKIKEVRKLVNEAGVKEHQVTTVLGLLLPYARKEYNAFIADIPNLESSSNSTDRTVVVSSSKHGGRLKRYIFLFDILTTKAKEYSVMFEPGKEESKRRWGIIYEEEFKDGRDVVSYGYGRASFNKFAWSWRSKDGESDARKAVRELFDRALSEFEFRAMF